MFVFVTLTNIQANVFMSFDKVVSHSNEGNGTTEAVRSVVRVCLRNAAVLNYEKISDFAQHEGAYSF